METDALSVTYADEALLVLEKPAGLLSVPGRGADKQDCLSTRAQSRYADALVVHRLDMATSGLLVMARGKVAQRVLSRAFANRQVHKKYVALVHGRLAPSPLQWGMIDLPIAIDWPNRPRRVIEPGSGKASVTRWRVLPDTEGEHTRIDIQDTGAGLTNEQMGRLYRPFERLGAEASDVEGHGLGLLICKELVASMRGTIQVQSAVGHGTTFTVFLPSSECCEEPTEGETSPETAAGSSG